MLMRWAILCRGSMMLSQEYVHVGSSSRIYVDYILGFWQFQIWWSCFLTSIMTSKYYDSLKKYIHITSQINYRNRLRSCLLLCGLYSIEYITIQHRCANHIYGANILCFCSATPVIWSFVIEKRKTVIRMQFIFIR